MPPSKVSPPKKASSSTTVETTKVTTTTTKVEAWGESTTPKSDPSSSPTKTTSIAKVMIKDDGARVFLPISADLCGLVVSSWFVPTVKRPFKGVATFALAIATQMGFLLYMCVAIYVGMYESPPKSPCNAPALLQLIALFTFASTCVTEINSINLLQIVMYCKKLRVPGSPEPTPGGNLKMGADAIIDVRPTSTRARMLLALAPFAEFIVEMMTLLVGAVYLCLSENVEELILNAVAVNFVTQIDDVMLTAFVHKASRERLAKYQYETRWGVEEGDTQLKGASESAKRLLKLQEFIPFVILLLSAAVVGGGQVLGRIQGTSTCTWFVTGS